MRYELFSSEQRTKTVKSEPEMVALNDRKWLYPSTQVISKFLPSNKRNVTTQRENVSEPLSGLESVFAVTLHRISSSDVLLAGEGFLSYYASR